MPAPPARHTPPSTTFGPKAPVQAKASLGTFAPPPTAYGGQASLQTKSVVPPQFRQIAAIQRMEGRWDTLSNRPYGKEFLKAYDDGSILYDMPDSAIELLYQKFFGASTMNAFNKNVVKETYTDLVDTENYAGLIAAFKDGNPDIRYDPEGFHCQMISQLFIPFLLKLGLAPTPISTQGNRVIVRCPSPIDPTWTGGRVTAINGGLIAGLRGFSEHHAVKIGTTVIDPTCGYVGNESSWYAALNGYTAPVNKLKALFGTKPITNHAVHTFYSVENNTVEGLAGIKGAAVHSGTTGIVTVVMPSLSGADITLVKETPILV